MASWNVNSIKARLPVVTRWMTAAQPDVVCLQEIKCVDEAFPYAHFEDMGYAAAVCGQKAYNGVAMLSRCGLEDVRQLPGGGEARYLEAVVTPPGGTPVRVASIYMPNGNPADGPKFPYKLEWMTRMAGHAAELLELEEALVLAGDYNVIPTAQDVHDPRAWKTDALFLPESRNHFRRLLNLGFTDAWRACHDTQRYTFWGYRGGAWAKNHGVRIDHLLLSPQAADRLTGCGIDPGPRSWERPSDHVPIWAALEARAKTPGPACG